MKGSSLVSRHMASPNINERSADAKIDMLLLHYTGMETADISCARLCSPASQVSCHYLIDEAGLITQMVSEEQRAWHAGVSSWKGVKDINSCSIGIEIQNQGHTLVYEDFPAPQMEAVASLCRDIIERYAIVPERILAHSDVAPARKIDPGEKFDWQFLHEHGVGHWVRPQVASGSFLQYGDQGEPVEALQALLALYGYDIEMNGQYDIQTQIVVKAFQRHFRPSCVDGVADPATVKTLRHLLQMLPAQPV